MALSVGAAASCEASRLAAPAAAMPIVAAPKEAATVGMDHHVDIVWIIERQRRTLEGRVFDAPGRGVARPDHAGNCPSVGGQAFPATLDMEITLIPEAGLDLRRDPFLGKTKQAIVCFAESGSARRPAAAPAGPV
jgi:hypothetical protein